MSSGPPLGRPRCEEMPTRAPFSSRYLIVGIEARMRVSSVMVLPSSGTLRSHRMKTCGHFVTKLQVILLKKSTPISPSTFSRFLQSGLLVSHLLSLEVSLLEVADRLLAGASGGRHGNLLDVQHPGRSIDRSSAKLRDERGSRNRCSGLCRNVGVTTSNANK